MTADSLQKILALVNGADDIPDEDKQAAAQALASDFSDAVDVPDDEATDSMPAPMRARYQASDTPAEEKAGLLENAKHFLRMGKISVMHAAAAEPAKDKAKEKDAPLTVANLRSIVKSVVDESNVRNFGSFARGGAGPQNFSANPANGNAAAAATPGKAFFQKIKGIEMAAGVNRGKAILLAAAADKAGATAWNNEGRPEE